MPQQTDFDVVIIGGGPAGASLGAYLARAGAKCAVFESELFPRPHVGESLVPSSTRVFRDLDFLPTMEAYKFPRKYGAAWTSITGKEYDCNWEGLAIDTRADVRFDEREQPGVMQDYTYHVDRGLFDNLLLQHAARLGAQVYEGVAARDVDLGTADGEPARLYFSMGHTERQHEVTAQLVVDASGRKTFLGNRLKLKVRDPVFDQYAIHTWFEGYDRGTTSSKDDYIYIHFLPLTNTWVWQIPITETITSFGVVTQKKSFAKTTEGRESFFWECLRTRPEVYEKLRASRQLRPFTEEGDYSYAMKQIAGDRFVLIGDAGRFVDPIFSTGVSIALNSARFVHTDILGALERGDFSKRAFSKFETTIRRGTNNWYEFISLYYRLNVLFTAFVRDPRYRLDVLKLLQGDVYDEEAPAVLRRMREIVTAVETTPNHVWHAMLGDLTADAFRPQF